MAGQQKTMLPEVLRSSFCGRSDGRWDDPTTDAGVLWMAVVSNLERG